jgi:glycosyltransferase involved in cell wall biosynthesis
MSKIEKKTRILFVSTNADRSGAPLHVLSLILNIPEEMYEIVCIFGEKGFVQQELQSAGIKTYVVGSIRSSINPLEDLKSVESLKLIISFFRPHLIHCHSSKAALVGRIAAARFNIPVIYTVHGWGFGPGRKPHVSLFVRSAELLLKAKTKKYITVSEYDRQLGISRLGIPKHHIETIHNGINFEASDPQRRPFAPKVIMVARHSYPKDYASLARALALTDFSEAFFVGLGTDQPDFVASMRELSGKSAHKIRFMGLREDVSSLLEHASIFVLSSRFEGLPLSIIEAMSKGLPIVASEVGGIPELVLDGQNGFLFPVGDSLAMSRCISKLTANPDLTLRLGSISLKLYLSQFTVDRMVSQTMMVYEKVLAEAPQF